MLGLVLFLTVFILCWVLAGSVRRTALRLQIVDVPNARSSHKSPTPRGGGIVVAVYGVASPLALAAAGLFPWHAAAAFAIGGAIVSGTGGLDDLRSRPAGERLAAHVVAAVLMVTLLGGMPVLNLGVFVVPLGISGAVLGVIGAVWLINAYNFMDGVDGIAAVHAASGALFAAITLSDRMPGLALYMVGLSAASFGLLLWNWAPAKLFMGDVGSGFLGFTFAAMVIAASRLTDLPPLLVLLPFAAFLLDATVTLLRRIVRGDRWYEAHRSHLYQRLVQGGWTHARVTSVYGILSLVGGVGVLLGNSHVIWTPAVIVGIVTIVGATGAWLEWRLARRTERAEHAPTIVTDVR